MARKTTPPAQVAPKLTLSVQDIERGLARLADRIGELAAFDVSTVTSGMTPELKGLEVAVKDTLIRCFGENTSAYLTYQAACNLTYYPMMVTRDYRPNYAAPVDRNIKNAIALLTQAQRSLNEDLADIQHSISSNAPTANFNLNSKRIFIVHGHDDGPRETAARFLEKIGFEPIILHEQANRGRTIIEKIEANRDVGFAVVLLTPDDEGCVRGAEPEPRARQNVLLELGYFLGYLGRDKVCALKKGSLEIPSDFAGVVWTSMDSDGWKQALSLELQDAGYKIDWNKVMRS
ncbi:nucleotide-binding protein [Pseudomonas proteolytica]|uniref:nucleotide-binding protein n=1 Tax=Pseudomonas proteolytica TaxID=219574 RepID=UPI0030EE2D22